MRSHKISWIIQEQYEGMKLRTYLRQVLKFSNSLIRAIRNDGGKLIINDRTVDVRYLIKTGDRLTVIFPKETRGYYMKAENIPLSIVYEDDHLLIIDKPANIATLPNPHIPSGTIANGVLGYYDQNHLPYTAHIVTRLDRETSGLMLIAKHRYIHSLLASIQQRNEIYREYRAIVEGRLHNKRGEIHLPIGRKPGSFIERMITTDGKEALTEFQVLKEWKNYSLMKVRLKTGRTHQIRVHFSAIGHPVVGDDLYGKYSTKISRQALHCYQIQFQHPILDKSISLTCEMPEDMQRLMESN